MKQTILSATFILYFMSCTAQNNHDYATEINAYRAETDLEFKDPEQSPLKEEDRNDFKGLKYYQADETYRVEANLTRLRNGKVFEMKTTTSRLPVYQEWGKLNFILKDTACTLMVYKNIELSLKEGYEDYLFIPFMDNTNGFGSYGGGRYLDVREPQGNILILDFNKAYNPYCAYNDRYSCPIPPKENYLNLQIAAGVKAFKDYNAEH